MREHQTNPYRDSLQNYWFALFKIIKVTKDKDISRNSSGLVGTTDMATDPQPEKEHFSFTRKGIIGTTDKI